METSDRVFQDKANANGAYPDGYAALKLTPDRWDDVVDIDEWAFLGSWLPEERAANKDAFEWSRASAIAIVDDRHGTPGDLCAVRCSYPFSMLVPGGMRVPTAGLSWVGVHPGHRRRGLLTSMIREHFEHSLLRGEYISVLTASEPKIYQRFGYGLATWQLRATFSRGAELREVGGSEALTVRLERLRRDDHADLMADLQRRVERPGSIVREGEAMTANLFASDVNERRQDEALRIAIVSSPDGQPQAFAVFRRKPRAGLGSPSGEVSVFNFVTTTPASARRLWGVLLDLDLTSEVVVTSLPLDDRLMWLAKDQRAPQATVSDELWLRILDVPLALEARTYAAPLDLVIHVTDQQIDRNAGLWRLATGDAAANGQHTATVTRVTSGLADAGVSADLSLGIQELSAAYLGGVSIPALVEAGLVEEHTPDASRLLSAAMHSPLAPSILFHF